MQQPTKLYYDWKELQNLLSENEATALVSVNENVIEKQESVGTTPGNSHFSKSAGMATQKWC